MQAYLAANTAVAHTREHYAGLIRADLQKSEDHHRQSVEGIIAAGLHLLQAKKDLRGEFQKMVKAELGWSQDKAEMLMAIAKNPTLTNPNMFGLLPKSWSTLFLMSKAEPEVLEMKLTDGVWNPETERKQVQAMLTKSKTADESEHVRTPDQAEEQTTADPVPKELTSKQKKLHDLLNADHDLLGSYLEQFLPGVERFIGPAFDKPTVRDELLAIVERKQLVADLPLEREAANYRKLPMRDQADLDSTIAPPRESTVADYPKAFRPNDAPSVVPSKPYVADTRTADEIIGEMPDHLRRVRPKPKPSFAPEALQELIDAGVDPDEPAERLQEQIERWS